MSSLLALALLVLWTVIGVPWVILSSRRSVLPVPLTIAVSPAVGVVIVMLTGVLFGRMGLYGFAWALILVVTAAGYLGVARLVRRPSATGTRLLVVIAASGLAALVFRSSPIEFLFQTGDMGEYVATGIRLAESGIPSRGFPPGFSSTLAFSFALGGLPVLSSTVVALSLVTLGALLFVGYQLGLRTAALLVVGLFVALQIHFVWFGVFPVSESLFAAIAMGGLALAMRALAVRSSWLSALSGLVVGSLVFVRADGPAYVVALSIGALALAALSRPFTPIAVSFMQTAAITSSVAFGYLIRYHHEYMVDRQLTDLAPRALFTPLRDTFIFDGSLGTLVFWTIAGISGAVVARVLAMAVSPDPNPASARRTSLLAVVGVIAIGLVSAFAVLSAPRTYLDLAVRAGPLFVTAAVLSATLLGLLALRRRTAAVLILAVGAATALSLVIHALRFPNSPDHAYYLYWDRYLYSVSIPAMLVLIVVAISVLQVARFEDSRISQLAMGASWILLILLAANTFLGIDQAMAANRDHMFGDASDALESTASAIHRSGEVAVYYAGGDLPEGWFFPNTFRAIGLPLLQTYDVPFVNLPSDPFGGDPTLDTVLSDIAEIGDVAAVVQVQACDSDCQVHGLGTDSAGSEQWLYRYRVPVNSGMRRLPAWSDPWLEISVFVVNPDQSLYQREL